jgi:hypothetical protein
LTAYFNRGEPILFSGAGFSFGATDREGNAVPQAAELKDEIWDLVWPDEPVASGSTLRDTYAAALSEAAGDLKALLEKRLDIDPESVADYHRTWLSMPWRRAFTINIDNLEQAVQRAYTLPRRITSFSGLQNRIPEDNGADLLYVHLNGTLDDVPDVTFSDPQYGLRHAESSVLYEQLVSGLIAYPIIFVGTQLQESLFWNYIALRDEKGPRGVKDMRRGSYLVSPDLSKDRERLLATYGVQWIKATAEGFAVDFLKPLLPDVEDGHTLLRQRGTRTSGEVVLPTVAELSEGAKNQASDYLFGADPSWADVMEGRAVDREFEAGLDLTATSGVVLVTGTAGSGVSTTLLRLAIRLAAEDRDVRWLGAEHHFDARDLARTLRDQRDPLVLLIDDADTFGEGLDGLVSDVSSSDLPVLLFVGMRSTRVDRVLRRWKADDEHHRELVVPLLQDSDIERLLDALRRDRKLGALKGLSEKEQRARISDKCGRQLLVAMIEATSGEKFEVKALEEYGSLEGERRLIYAIVAIATELRHPLQRDVILQASEDMSNSALYALERLNALGLLSQNANGGYTVRHRRIAELVVSHMRQSAEMLGPYRGLARCAAMRYDSNDRKAPSTKLVRALISHSRMARSLALPDARSIYQDLETPMDNDYHFWLQRGSLEVEYGLLSKARNYLQQARGGGGEHDFRVQTEWAYYLIKSAAKNPTANDAERKVEEGQQILLDQIAARGSRDSYPWHVYGSQMLSWLRHGSWPEDKCQRELEQVKVQLEDGVRAHPSARDLRDLLADVKNEWLLTATK